jgi:hypothetical protein
MLGDFVAQTGAICKKLPPEAISTCQSDLSLMNQSVSRLHRTRRIISEITKDKGEEVFQFDNKYIRTKRKKEDFLISLGQFPKFCSVLCQAKTPIIIRTE